VTPLWVLAAFGCNSHFLLDRVCEARQPVYGPPL
jgi:hypothetical protein